CSGQRYGQDCISVCPQFCEVGNLSQSVCDHIHGTCLLGCQAGYLGSMCDESCSGQRYGQDCSSVCSQFCEVGYMSQSVCDHIHGTCLLGCQAGYLGSMCDESCDHGTYGTDCSSYCSQFCVSGNISESACDHTDGRCLYGCQAGYQLPKCNQQCDRGTYGQDCNSTCPQHCENTDINGSVCNHTSGACTQGCQPGYTGLLCDE
ncbi:unnamed protein product, partial [Candidula unifasciata]